jgi:hypothetical protein
VEIDGKRLGAQPMILDPNLKLDVETNIDWKTAPRLYDMAPFNVIEWGKGMRGWLRFLLPKVDYKKSSKSAKLTLILTDPMGRKHKIKYEVGSHPSQGLTYLPGSGFKAG